MSFGLEPADFLQYLVESHDEYRREPLSVRRAMVCCVFANHLPDYLVAKYSASDPAKLHGHVDLGSYRAYLAGVEPSLAVIRDLCDYAKHAWLRRKSAVARTEQASTLEMDIASFAIGVPNHVRTEKLIVTHEDGSERWLAAYLREAVTFWQSEFTARSL